MDSAFVKLWSRLFVTLLLLNASLVGSLEFSNKDDTSSVARTVLSWSVVAANYPGMVTATLVGGDELDERFGTPWSAALMCIFSLPWLALAAAVVTEVRVERGWRRRTIGSSGRGLSLRQAPKPQ